MSFIDEIFSRANMQNIREFLLYGVEEYEVSKETYLERLKSAERKANQYLRSLYDSDDEYGEASSPVFEYASVIENVYMEIGLQCGFTLAMEMMSNSNPHTDAKM